MIGERIRKRRQEKGLSLRDLGSLTELTAGFLSHIENGKVSPSLASLQRIATALDVPMFDFLNNGEPLARPVVRAGDRRRLYFPGSHMGYDLLTYDLTRKLMPLLVRMEPGARRVAARLARPTEQWMFVMQGRLEITVNSDRYVLETGDSIHYDGEALREFASIGEQELIAVCCMTPPAL